MSELRRYVSFLVMQELKEGFRRNPDALSLELQNSKQSRASLPG
jgi:hypothetical protein